ncbi:hypothetical protein OXX69_004167 [Metschnikowia pulcherrima]
MRVTRSRSAGTLAKALGAQTPQKVAKPRKPPSATANGIESTLELAQKDAVNSKNLQGKAVKDEFNAGVLEEDAKLPPSPSKRQSKPHIESIFAHIVTPTDLALPSEFVSYHTPEFVEAIQHVVKIDPTLYPAVAHDNFEAFARTKEESKTEHELINNYWYSLISSVISQQVSGSAAKAIKTRFKDLFAGPPSPTETLKLPQDKLKAVGLSSMKLKYVIHISEVFSDPTSNLTSADFYKTSTSAELVAELTKLKGIGEWSASMFAVFTLKELDIFAYDDLGVARGVSRYLQVRPKVLEEVKAGVHAVEELKARLKRKSKFHMDKSKRDWTPLHDEYVKFLALKFEPLRTAFMLIMWRLSATNIDALEKK